MVLPGTTVKKPPTRRSGALAALETVRTGIAVVSPGGK